MDYFGLVCRRHQDHPWQAAETGRIERTSMGMALDADLTCTIRCDSHWHAQDYRFVDDLVASALEKCETNHRKRPHAGSREACGGCHAVSLGEPDIECWVRECHLEGI